MKLLEKIKDEYAKELHCQDWYALLMEISIKQEELDVHDEISKRYAKAVLERAADNARMETVFTKNGERTTINKQSILNTKID